MTSWLATLFTRLRPEVKDGWRVSILAALPVAICAYLVALWLEYPSGQYNVFDHASYLAISLLFASFELFLLTHRWSTTKTVLAIIVVVYLQFIGKLIFLLYFNPHPQLTQAEFTETFFWLPCLFVLGAFVPGLTKGRVIVVGFFTLFAAISTAYVVPNLLAGRNFGVTYALIELILANTTLLTLSHHFLGFKENFAKTSARAEALARLVYEDTLTGLPNRLALDEELDRLIQTRGSTKLAAAFVDIDGFKVVNDTRGHAVGDELLQQVARRLASVRRGADLVFRISGDEFVVVFTDLVGDSDVQSAGERLHLALAPPFDLKGQPSRVTASIGVALCPEQGVTVGDLLKHADSAMYTVKRRGKNAVMRYDAARDSSTEDRTLLLSELQHALRHDQLELHYQPIFDLTTNKTVKAEALLRWHSPSRGDVPPTTFIALAEEHGLMTQLGSYVLEQACLQVGRWNQQGLTDLVVSVNVSAYQLQDPDFASLVKRLLVITRTDPAKLELELTESAVIHTLEQAAATLRNLRQFGVGVAVDDFGTGYSSLSYLETLDFDTIKLDRSFAAKLASSRKSPQYSVAIIRAVLEIANTLGAEVVAEGIETREQLEIFRGLGCHLLQGYYFGRPLPAAQLTALLRPSSTETYSEPHRVVN